MFLKNPCPIYILKFKQYIFFITPPSFDVIKCVKYFSSKTVFHSFERFQEIDPKTPSEALAKELRQTRLTVERLECEKKELEFKLSTAGV